jgi:hypothetical protein
MPDCTQRVRSITPVLINNGNTVVWVSHQLESPADKRLVIHASSSIYIFHTDIIGKHLLIFSESLVSPSLLKIGMQTSSEPAQRRQTASNIGSSHIILQNTMLYDHSDLNICLNKPSAWLHEDYIRPVNKTNDQK